MKLFVVIAVDFSDTSDHKGYILATFKDYDAALGYVREDMEAFQMEADRILNVNYDKMCVWNDDYTYGCEWNIDEIELN